MKRLLITILVSFLTIAVYATQSDSLKLANLQREVTRDSIRITNIQKKVTALESAISTLKQENTKLQNLYQKQLADVDSLGKVQCQQADTVDAIASKLGSDLSNLTEANKKTEDSVGIISVRSWLGIVGILIAIVLLCVLFFVFRRKIRNGSSSIEKIKEAQESLAVAQKAMQEESVKLDGKLVELLERQVAVQPQKNADSQADHSLALKVADEIVRIETNLSRMDESVKGYKQLKRAVERIRTNFLANGYEIVDMLGKPYNEGMKLSADFVSDKTLAEGEQKITGIIKPQINYKGKMIQAAQITVSQNI